MPKNLVLLLNWSIVCHIQMHSFFLMRAALVVIFSFLSPMSHALWEHRKLQDCTLFL